MKRSYILRIQMLTEAIKQDRPHHWALGNSTSAWPPVTPFTTTLWAQPASRIFTHQLVHPTHSWRSQFLQANAVGDGVKGFTKV